MSFPTSNAPDINAVRDWVSTLEELEDAIRQRDAWTKKVQALIGTLEALETENRLQLRAFAMRFASSSPNNGAPLVFDDDKTDSGTGYDVPERMRCGGPVGPGRPEVPSQLPPMVFDDETKIGLGGTDGVPFNGSATEPTTGEKEQ